MSDPSPAPSDVPEARPALLIKRYASRRLYNTETSDYVTLEDIAAVIRAGREVRIVDLKSGDDLTRQYLLQIIVEHESRGESILPVDVLTDLVRSYAGNAQSVVPQFLAASFEMLRQGQTRMLENLASFPAPLAVPGLDALPGLEALRRQQQKFLQAMTATWPTASSGPEPDDEDPPGKAAATDPDEMAEIRRQLAELQSRIGKL
ncbi:polyhydroxyalkanoate synthesis repressor PhaR [Paracoccus suum]|uniref:Polyhydroxyalkanoate synthesis repressor PhaR n=1 Tax=Paracoccus suum TaxID=2259340 RepID=A0A344PLB6_9RHOB|nr:polyhydroxyalkanoate synthesis repressor PhaR [Paracoccus suum]AXC50171.1 polyhydroxyalkanoate synthesis repressor PhaR [Paracoccus suum]